MMREPRFRVWTPCLGLATVLASLAGCGGEPSRYVATGTVKIDGKPAPMVVVAFRPADPTLSVGGTGVTDDSGKFSIGENGKNTGLPVGEYKVTFSQTLVKGKPTLSGSGGNAEEKTATEREVVADEYRDLAKTPVVAKIGGSTNEFNFEVKAKK